MSPTGSQPWTTGFQTWRRGSHNPGMRASDADRTEVADLLSKHYSAGRLDQAEFDDRMHRAMSAKTQGDFAGLFDDLPDLPGPDQAGTETAYRPVPRRQRVGRVPLDRLLFFAFVIAIAIVLGHTLIHSVLIWLLIGLLALILLRGAGRRRRS